MSVSKEVSEAYFAKLDALQTKQDIVVKKFRESSPGTPEYDAALTELKAIDAEMSAIMETSPFKNLRTTYPNNVGSYANDGGRRRKTRKSKRRVHKTRRHRV
jgi:hypothetical protein